MVDFSSLLKKPAGEAKKPPALPAGDYPVIVKSFSHVKAKTGTMGFEFVLGLTGWPEDGVDDEDKAGIDVSKRQMRSTCWVKDEDQLWRLDEILRDCFGITMAGKDYEEALQESVGSQCVAQVEQQLNSNSGETMNVVERLRPAA